MGSAELGVRPAVKIRLFKLRNLRSVLKIEGESFGREGWPASLFREYAHTCSDLFLIVTLGRRIVGYSIACLAAQRRVAASLPEGSYRPPSLWGSCLRMPRLAELVSIGVLPQYRSRGIATALLNTTIRKAGRMGATAICLMVRPGNQAAIQFYRKFGFVRTSTVSGYYEDGSVGWRMKLSLTGGR